MVNDVGYKNFKTVWVQNVDEGIQFSHIINVPFPVKEMVVKQVMSDDIDNVNNTDSYDLLRTDLIGGQILCVIQSVVSLSNTCYTRFKMNDDNINSEYTFRWSKIGDLPVDAPATFHMNIAIEILFLG